MSETAKQNQPANEIVVRNDTVEVPADYEPPHPNELIYEPQPKRTVVSELVKYITSGLILGLGVAIYVGLASMKKPPGDQAPTALIPMVGTIEAAPYEGDLDMIVSGTVVPFREITVAAEVSGNIIKKYPEFEAGNFVKKGTLLLEIDPENYELQLKTNEAEVQQSERMLDETQKEIDGARRNVELAKNDFDLQRREYQRNVRLQGVLSASEIDQAKRNMLTAQTQLSQRKNTLKTTEARLERMKAALTLAKSNLNRRKVDLEKTSIVAPDDGVIVREMVQEGNFVRQGDPIVTFEDTSRSEVLCNLTTSDLTWIRNNSSESEDESENDQQSLSVYHLPKTKVSIYERSDSTAVWTGILERFDGIGRDERTKTIPCRITVKEPIIQTPRGRRALVRGMYVKCKIQVSANEGSDDQKFISFPAVALRPGGYVWTADNRELKKYDVEVVDRTERKNGDEVEKIVVARMNEDGVKPGNLIVTSPLSQPTDGTKVIFEGENIEAKEETKVEDKKDWTGATNAKSRRLIQGLAGIGSIFLLLVVLAVFARRVKPKKIRRSEA